MRLVVSDAGPLHYLVLCGGIDVLPRLYGEIVIPEAVVDELTAANTPEAIAKWIKSRPAWLQVVSPAISLEAASLGKGERDAIALAQQLRADAILIDERVGRRAAREAGLLVIGTIGVLEDAAREGLLDLKPVLERLATTNIRLSPELIADALERDRVRKGQ